MTAAVVGLRTVREQIEIVAALIGLLSRAELSTSYRELLIYVFRAPTRFQQQFLQVDSRDRPGCPPKKKLT